MHKFLAYILFTLLSLNVHAQNLGKERTAGVYTYVYRLNATQAKSLLQNKICSKPFTNSVSPYTKALVDSFATDSGFVKTLPAGNYLFVKADKKNLVAYYRCITGLDAAILPDYGKSKLVVYKPDGSLLTDGLVKVRAHNILFDNSIRAYPISYRGYRKFITIETATDTLFYAIANPRHSTYHQDAGEVWEAEWHKITQRFRSLKYRTLWAFKRITTVQKRGYIVFNKPKYQPGDTVKLKVFITTLHGRPLKKKLDIKLLEGYYYDGRDDNEWRTISKGLEPVTPGAYLYQFVIADSFKMDTRYQIGFSGHRKKIMLHEEFKTEDYLLKTDKYHAKTDKENYTIRDTIKITAGGTDFNGLPVMDGIIKVTCITKTVSQYNEPVVFVPDTLFQFTGTLNSSGKADFDFPADHLPPVNLDADIYFTLANSNHETWDTITSITYLSSQHRLQVKQVTDSIYADYLADGAAIKGNGRVVYYHANDTAILASLPITYPYTAIVKPQAKRCIFYADHDSITEQWVCNAADGVICYSTRNDSAALFYIVNSNSVPLHYSIYRNAACIEKGICNSMNKMLPDRSNAFYTIVIQYEWAGESHAQNYRCEKMKDILKINLTNKQEIYPGQKDTIHLHVKDFYNRPVNKANLTAYSINAQFKGDIAEPKLPGWHKYRRFHRKIYQCQLLQPDYTAELQLYKYPEWQKRMNLQSLPYYRMIYPQHMFAIYIDSLPYLTPQLGLYIYKNGRQVKIYSIHIDNKLVYTEQNQMSTPYSFNVPVGLHEIKVRTFNREWTFGKTRFDTGRKLELSCNYDSLLAIIPKPNRKTYYLPREINELRIHTTALSSKQNYSQNFYLAQGNRVFTFNGAYYKNAIVGPISSDSLLFYHTTTYPQGDQNYSVMFLPEQGYTYHFRNSTTIMENFDPYKDKIKLRSEFLYDEYAFGELALYPETPVKPKPAEPEKYFIDTKTGYRTPNTGRLLMKLETDTDFSYISLVNANNSLMYYAQSRYQTYGYNNYYDWENNNERRNKNQQNSSVRKSEYLQDFYAVTPGLYQVVAITPGGMYANLGTVIVKADGINYYALRPERFYLPFNTKQLKSFSPNDDAWNRLPIDTLNTQSGVAGTVYDEHGDAIPFARITILIHDTPVANLRTDINGNYFYPTDANETLSVKAGAWYYDSVVIKNAPVKKGNVTIMKVKLPRQRELSATGEVVITADKQAMKLSEMSTSVEVIRGDYLASVPGVNMLSANYSISTSNALKEVVVSGSGYARKGAMNFELNENSKDKLTCPVFGGSVMVNIRSDSTITSEGIATKYAAAKSTRSNFKDYGFWQPNLVTDKNGNANFEVEYPDNLTSWRTYVLAMSRKRRSGKEVTTVRSFKDLTASLSAPQFLLEGDSAVATGKLFNYTTGIFTGTLNYSVNGNTLFNKLIKLDTSFIEPAILLAPLQIQGFTDTVKTKFGFTLPSGYADGEERAIPVFRKGTVETKGAFWSLTKDTSFIFKPEAGMGAITLYGESDLLKVLLEEIKLLKNYPYWCTEQTASKLIGLCMEQKIDSALGIKFKDLKEKKNLTEKLYKLQNYAGGWSWWQYKPDVYITNYVMKALSLAEGHPSYSSTRNAVSFLRDEFRGMSTEEKLSTLETLAGIEDQKDYVKQNLPAIKFDSITIEQKMRVIKTELLCGIDISILWEKMLMVKNTTVFGGSFWGYETYNFVNNSMAATLCAYEIADMKGDEELKQQIITYLLTCRSHTGWRSTFESARILSTILPDVVKQRGRNLTPPVLTINGLKNSSFPYQIKVDTVDTITISKSGTEPVYLTAYQRFFNQEPQPVRDLYDVKTSFEKSNVVVTKLKAGELTTLAVTVTAKKYGEYVGIEVPIPAGCAYARKDFPYYDNEVHREYFKDKVVIFCDKLPVGTSTFHILLEPRYSGSYSLNPARVELMYFPVFYGRNSIERITITNQ